jgi:hypothetical protein
MTDVILPKQPGPMRGQGDFFCAPADVPEMFDAGNPGNSICWRDLALDSR